jgi:hypothetical protein
LSLGAFGRDAEHSRDDGGVLGVAQRGVAKQRPDRGEPQVASPRAVAAGVLEVVEERGDQRLVEVLPVLKLCLSRVAAHYWIRERMHWRRPSGCWSSSIPVV